MCQNIQEGDGDQFYLVVFDTGKPYDKTYYNEDDLKQGLKEFYEQNKNKDNDYDLKIYNEKDEDISESQFITEMISDIMERE